MNNIKIKEILNKFKLSSLRGKQEEIIKSIMSKKDTIGIMATGGGKTLCYQIPSMLINGWVMVISPLIALMDDQINNARSRGITATKISGYMDKEEKKINLDLILNLNNGLLLLSPEILNNPYIFDRIKQNNPSLIIFDEAHCISTWGQDFRPEYAEVGRVINSFENNIHIPRLALTATASDDTIKDICIFSKMIEPKIIKSTMYRDNLFINISYDKTVDSSFDKIINEIKVVSNLNKPIIIYGKTRKECDCLSEDLLLYGFNNVIHHSGLDLNERQANAELFLSGQIKIIVATMGFGMGIDKKDVYIVIHTQVPGTAESWYQEIGRGGRDGSDSFSIGHVYTGITKKISSDNLFRNDSYIFSLKMANVLFSNKCRMQSLLSCFNENIEPCKKCDICCGRHKFYDCDINEVLSQLELIKNHKYNEDNSSFLLDSLYANGLIDYFIFGSQYRVTIQPTLTIKGLNYLQEPFIFQIPSFTKVESININEKLSNHQLKKMNNLILDNHYHYLLKKDKRLLSNILLEIKDVKNMFNIEKTIKTNKNNELDNVIEF